ncbi:hypothetical protein WI89_11140 [Burkholderia ubonensis]|uniref:Tn3 family transposase n=1 Tax=Burkholderia ubonensis TaxID=101571 RepID=UPI0007584914|nr:Tn3 family transposase [Burkholderia ubonensis]KVD74295.1 hypothetical protein WI89_11140 [Burkholderia ubonensis]
MKGLSRPSRNEQFRVKPAVDVGDEVAISGSLTLLMNLVIAWNTQRMQATVDGWRRKGRQVDDEWLRRMGPAHFAHVNFRGTLSFPIDQYSDVLLEAAPWQRGTGS